MFHTFGIVQFGNLVSICVMLLGDPTPLLLVPPSIVSVAFLCSSRRILDEYPQSDEYFQQNKR